MTEASKCKQQNQKPEHSKGNVVEKGSKVSVRSKTGPTRVILTPSYEECASLQQALALSKTLASGKLWKYGVCGAGDAYSYTCIYSVCTEDKIEVQDAQYFVVHANKRTSKSWMK